LELSGHLQVTAALTSVMMLRQLLYLPDLQTYRSNVASSVQRRGAASTTTPNFMAAMLRSGLLFFRQKLPTSRTPVVIISGFSEFAVASQLMFGKMSY
jgi:hypothetical protein